MALLSRRLVRRILVALARGERDVTTLKRALGRSISDVSRQLGDLQRSGVVLVRVDGSNRYYRLTRIEVSFPDSSVCFTLTAQDRTSARIITPIIP